MQVRTHTTSVRWVLSLYMGHSRVTDWTGPGVDAPLPLSDLPGNYTILMVPEGAVPGGRMVNHTPTLVPDG